MKGRNLEVVVRSQDSTIYALETRIKLDSTNHLSRIAEDSIKLKAQKNITGYMVRRGDDFRSEADFYQKRSRKFRRQRDGLGVGILIMTILAIL